MMRVVIYGQLLPGGPIAPLVTADGDTYVELNTSVAEKLRELATQFDQVQGPARPDAAFEEIARRYYQEPSGGSGGEGADRG